MPSSFLISALVGALLLFGTDVTTASNPYSSNVVALTTSNWKDVVLDNPHAVFVNICRSGWGYCQRLQSDWEKLASSTKGIVTIAYWDTEGGSRPPRLLGDYKGTPTIRLFKTKKKQRKQGSHAEKLVLDYQHGERNVKDMKKFLEYQIPNYVERIKFGMDEYQKLKTKADKYGLPIALLFTSKASTSTNIKWLSTEYRRRLLLVEVPPVTKNANLRQEIIGNDDTDTDTDNDDNTKKKLPALYIIPPSSNRSDDGTSSTIIKYEGDDYKRRKLQDFFDEHALKEPVFEPIIVENDDEGKEKQKKEEPTTDDTKSDTKEDETATAEKTKKKQSAGGGEEL